MYKKPFGYRVIHQNSLTSCPGPKKKEQVVKETSFKFIGKKIMKYTVILIIVYTKIVVITS